MQPTSLSDVRKFRDHLSQHISQVKQTLDRLCSDLQERSFKHDASKFSEPEFTPMLELFLSFKKTVIGTPEFVEEKQKMAVALEHHYRHNTHHPEHHDNGVRGMTLMDLCEMFADWRAAAKRHNNGDMMHSIHVGCDLYGIPSMLQKILQNTELELRSKED
jgi:hypothetical protein